MVLIYLVLGMTRYTEFDAHYFPGESIRITRLSEPKNYSLNGPDGVTVLCAELPCNTGDPVWTMGDADLGRLVERDLAEAGLPALGPIRQVVSRRLPQAYPIYERGYRAGFETIDQWLERLPNIVTLGRQGFFAHDNTHHTLAMAYAAAACWEDEGTFNRERWNAHRRAFEEFVVED